MPDCRRSSGCPLSVAGPGYPCRVENYWVAVFWSLIPTVVVSGLFFFVLRSILRADRTERRVYERIEAEQRAKRGIPAPQVNVGDSGPRKA